MEGYFTSLHFLDEGTCVQVVKRTVEARDARLDTVLRAFGQLYNHAALHADPAAASGLQVSLDKRWEKMDQVAFVLAYVLNPSCRFLHLAEGLHASHLAQAAQAVYRRLFPEDQEGALAIHGQFAEYSAGMDSFTGRVFPFSVLHAARHSPVALTHCYLEELSGCLGSTSLVVSRTLHTV